MGCIHGHSPGMCSASCVLNLTTGSTQCINSHRDCVGEVGKVCLLAKWPISAGAYPGFCSMTRQGIFLLPLGWNASPSQCGVEISFATYDINMNTGITTLGPLR